MDYSRTGSSHVRNILTGHHRKSRESAVKLLVVSTPYFKAGAVWQRIYGVWSCTKSALVIRWMCGMTPAQASVALLKMGADWRWKRITSTDSLVSSVTTNRAKAPGTSTRPVSRGSTDSNSPVCPQATESTTDRPCRWIVQLPQYPAAVATGS